MRALDTRQWNILTLWYLKNIPQIATTFPTEMWNPLTFNHISKIQQMSTRFPSSQMAKTSKNMFLESPAGYPTQTPGPCQLDNDEVGNGTWKPPKNASGSSARWCRGDESTKGSHGGSTNGLYGKNFAKMEFLLGRMSRWFECLLIVVFCFRFQQNMNYLEADSLRIRGASSPKWPRWTRCSEFVGIKSLEMSHALGF